MRRNLKMKIFINDFSKDDCTIVEHLENSGNCEQLIYKAYEDPSVCNTKGKNVLSKEIYAILKKYNLVADTDELVDIKIRIQD